MTEEITEHDLQVCIKAHQENKMSDNQIIQVFGKLANMVLAHRGLHFDHPESVIADAADLCLVKLLKYDSNGKAFNFFVTIIGCWLSQARRMQMNLRKMGKSVHN